MDAEMRFLGAIVILIGLTSASFASCPAERAIYHQNGKNGISLTFSKQKDPKSWSNIQADLAIVGRNFAFEFTESNGYPMKYMVSLDKKWIDKHDISVSFFDEKLTVLELPQVGKPAPQYIVTPELGLWIESLGFRSRMYLPPGMWKISGCQK